MTGSEDQIRRGLGKQASGDPESSGTRPRAAYEPDHFLSWPKLVERVSETNPELLEQLGEHVLEDPNIQLAEAYVPLGRDIKLEMTIRGYKCDGHWHPIPVYATKGFGVNPEGKLVSTHLTLDQLLAGDGGELRANCLHFFQSYCFHPDAGPEATNGNPADPIAAGTGTRRVATVDTGRVPALRGGPVPYKGHAPLNFIGGAPDGWPEDRETGHGPAIADLIGDLLGDRDRSSLIAVQPDQGLAYQLKIAGSQRWVRAFDTTALLAALDAAKESGCEILNLSLGRAASPADMRGDVVGKWLDRWLGEETQRAVVVAAGNHGTCVPSWPAAFCANWSAKSQLEFNNRTRVFSVASPRGTDSKFSGYSAQPDQWITNIRTGKQVQVAHPSNNPNSWTGTSFAAPQVAAELAAGHTPAP